MRELNLIKEIRENSLLIQQASYNYCKKGNEFSSKETRRDMRTINDLAHRCISLSEKLNSSLKYRKEKEL